MLNCATKFKLITIKNLLIIIILLPFCVFSQKKVYSFNQFQSRNAIQEWGNMESICDRKAEFTEEKIDINIDQEYHLSIESKTDLPDNGIIYLCKDENLNPITVMIFGNSKMYLYCKQKRFLINFEEPKKFNSYLADTD